MDIGTIHGIYTVIFMTAFIGMGVWVFLPRRKKTYDDAAALPFSEKNSKEDADTNMTDGSGRPD